ncbi:MAG: type ISP restriction/modification enzyme, partial [bacterium]
MFKKYLVKLKTTIDQGDAREESFYPHLKELFEEYSEQNNISDIHITVSPRKTDAGNPDFRIWIGKYNIVGYIEAKKPGTDLDIIEESEQLERYLSTFHNVILTNFMEFRLYRNGQKVYHVQLKEVFNTHQDINELNNLFRTFFSFSIPKAYNAKSLAKELAKRTRFLSIMIEKELNNNMDNNYRLQGFYKAFHEYLSHSLTISQFADLYAQTLTYGLFSARSRTTKEFNRLLAYNNIPKTIGILRDIFRFISLEDPPENIEWIIDDIAEVLSLAEINSIMDRYYHDDKGKDPVIHFYETFLSEYDPKIREKRGVYYTPEPIVSYITRSVNNILKNNFNKCDGLGDNTVRVLDPAAGTLTFIVKSFQLALEEMKEKYGDGIKNDLIKEHLLKNFYAFELMMAPYAIGHLKMGFILEELGYVLSDEERFNLFLTNTLEMENIEKTNFPGMSSLSEESRMAGQIKKEEPILVIIGNPPYSANSANVSKKDVLFKKGEKYIKDYEIRSNEQNKVHLLPIFSKCRKNNVEIPQKTWIGEQIEYYKILNGDWINESNPKLLHDDYVKFIRFSQWKIEQEGQGVLGFITNHSYLNNPTFRGMRKSLLETFDQIYILDLHGNTITKEIALDGSVDKNVFDVRGGVAITLFIKNKELDKKNFKYNLWGKRKYKYKWLESNDIYSTDWKEIDVQPKFYVFSEQDSNYKKKYSKFISLLNIFPVNSTGIKTHRDHFVIDINKDVLKERILKFRNPDISDEDISDIYSLDDNRDWKLTNKRKKIQEDDSWEENFAQILYRPFDIRHIFYHYDAIDYGKENVMKNMKRDNLALLFSRQMGNNKVLPALITDLIADCHSITSSTS